MNCDYEFESRREDAAQARREDEAKRPIPRTVGRPPFFDWSTYKVGEIRFRLFETPAQLRSMRASACQYTRIYGGKFTITTKGLEPGLAKIRRIK